ncbi:NADH:ubiquinone oxidoreductase subunit N [Neisseria gonorrhoeae]|nr:NADH:ubiquinone oxidoreductase subunit N [Neisseria gonorrhoeae]
MNWSDLNLMPALPEVALLSLLVLLLPADLWASDDKCRWTHYGALATVAVTAAVQLAVWEQGSTSSFNGMYIADGMSRLAKMVLYALTFVLFVYAKPYNQVRGIFKGEFYTLSLFALLGMSVMVSAGHFLTAYIGLELLSLALYALIALRRDSGFAAEAALKYFVLGALASGLLLYGISMVYGATGSLEFAGVLASSFNEEANEWLLKLGLVFIVVAVAFKLGAVPFHMWMPDVYHGAPTSVTALVGNLAAIMQTNIKRMLAYSTVSHTGFILLAFMAGAVGFAAGLYYAITYALMAAAGFGVLMVLSDGDNECENISDLAGLNQHRVWLAFLMLLVMFSMAGIPPLMGFYAKFGVIMALLKQGYVWLSVFAVVMSLVGAFYYLRVVKVMYFDESGRARPAAGGNNAAKSLLSVNVLLLVLWGIMPQTVIDWCAKALENTL